MGTAAICAGAMALIGISHYSGAEDPKPAPVFTMPASAPSASICEVRCPGYEEPDDSYHPAPAFLYEKPTVPTNGVVTVYVAAPVSAAQRVAAAPKAPKAKAASSTGSKATAAPRVSSGARQASPKQASTTVTVTDKQSTRVATTAKGSSTTTTSSTTTSTKHSG